MLEDLEKFGREKLAELAKEHPQATEWLARLKFGDDRIDMVKSLHKEDPELANKIAFAQQNHIFKAVYDGKEGKDGVYALAQKQIQSQIDNMPQEWVEAAKQAGIPIAELTERMKKNGAEKLAYAVASAVQEEINSVGWYSGKVAGDVFSEAKNKTWIEPKEGFWENPAAWIGIMIGNVINLVSNLFGGTKKEDLEKRGMEYAIADASERADEITQKVGKKLVTEMGMPASFAAETMLTTYQAIKGKNDPSFSLSYVERLAMKGRFEEEMKTAALSTRTEVVDAASAPTTEAASTTQKTAEYLASSGASKPEFNYPEFMSSPVAKHIKGHHWLTGNIGMTTGLILEGNEDRVKEVITSYIPDAKFSYDKKGSMIIEVGKDKYYWNRDGASMQDVLTPVMGAMKWAPVGKGIGLLSAGKSLLGKTLAAFGVTTGWAAATDTTASLIAGKPDVDVGNALLYGGSAATIPVLGVSAAALGALAKKLVAKMPLEVQEEAILKKAGVTAEEFRENVVNFFKNPKVAVPAAAGAAIAIPAAAAADESKPTLKGEPVEYSDVSSNAPFTASQTPPVAKGKVTAIPAHQ